MIRAMSEKKHLFSIEAFPYYAKQQYILKTIYIPFPLYEKGGKFSGQFEICTYCPTSYT